MIEMLAENGDSCIQKFKFEDFTYSKIWSKALDAATVGLKSVFLIIFCLLKLVCTFRTLIGQLLIPRPFFKILSKKILDGH